MKISQAWVFSAALLRHCLGFSPFSSRVLQETTFHIYLSSFHCPILPHSWNSSCLWPHFFCVAQAVKNPPASAEEIRDTGSIPGLRKPPGLGNGNPLQYSCLENPINRGPWQATVRGVAKSRTRLSTHEDLRVRSSSKGTQ